MPIWSRCHATNVRILPVKNTLSAMYISTFKSVFYRTSFNKASLKDSMCRILITMLNGIIIQLIVICLLTGNEKK